MHGVKRVSLVTMVIGIPARFLTLGAGEVGDSLLLRVMGHHHVAGKLRSGAGKSLRCS